MKNYKSHIRTGNSIVVIFEDGQMPVPKENPMFNAISEAIQNRAFDILPDLIDKSARIKYLTNGLYCVSDSGQILYKGQIIPKCLGDRLLGFVDAKIAVDPLVRFWENLSENPSESSKNDLYSFLEHNGHPITADGCFIAYRRVTNDFKDHYTKTIDNSVNTVVSMPREQVEQDRNKTCAAGLHVASWKYAAETMTNGPLVEVKVNPKNVVCVPPDYNEEKMRVCEFQIVDIAAGPRKEIVYPKFYLGEKVLLSEEKVLFFKNDDVTVDPNGVVTEVLTSEDKPNQYMVKFEGWEVSLQIDEKDLISVEEEEDDYEDDEDDNYDYEDDEDVIEDEDEDDEDVIEDEDEDEAMDTDDVEDASEFEVPVKPTEPEKAEETAADDGVQVTKMTVKTVSNGRLPVSRLLLRDIGLRPGQNVYVTIAPNVIEIHKLKPNSIGFFRLHIDNNGDLRLSRSILKSAGVECEEYQLTVQMESNQRNKYISITC